MFSKLRLFFLILILATTLQIAITSPSIITNQVDLFFKLYQAEKEKSLIAELRKKEKERAEQERIPTDQTKPILLPSPSPTPITATLSINFPITSGSLENTFVGNLISRIPSDKISHCEGITNFTLNGSQYEAFPSDENTILRRKRFEHNPEYETLIISGEGKILKRIKFETNPETPISVTIFSPRKKGEPPQVNTSFNSQFSYVGFRVKISEPRKIFLNYSGIEITSFLLDDIESWLLEKSNPNKWETSLNPTIKDYKKRR